MSQPKTNGHGRSDALPQSVAIESFPASRKIYVEGTRPDVRVPMREITLESTQTLNGVEENPPVVVYDTSGPWTDPSMTIDARKGLPALRDGWIEERGDTERLDGPSSGYGRERMIDPATASLRFEHIRAPRRARGDAAVTQIAYARRGVVTPE